MRRKTSIDPAYFEAMFKDNGDPWAFETSAYEAAKYDRTLEALPAGRIARMLEVGCANGVLTEKLGTRCDALLAIDVSDTALAAARARCAGQPYIRFENRRLPQDAPDGCFDVILLSEVVYYLDRDDVERLAAYLVRATPVGGRLLLVHWIGETDYPLSGDEAVATLRAALGTAVSEVHAERHGRYRLDLWQRR
jgi:SAM-dependent methyltransferase